MRLAFLPSLLLAAAPMHVSADMVHDPTVNGRIVESCPEINGAIDCQRVMTAATEVCKKYGFRKADSYYLHQNSMEGIQLKLSIDGQETVYRSEWAAGDLEPFFDAIDCSK